jgi:hypothetical protein
VLLKNNSGGTIVGDFSRVKRTSTLYRVTQSAAMSTGRILRIAWPR